jgi:hypothetical protein
MNEFDKRSFEQLTCQVPKRLSIEYSMGISNGHLALFGAAPVSFGQTGLDCIKASPSVAESFKKINITSSDNK